MRRILRSFELVPMGEVFGELVSICAALRQDFGERVSLKVQSTKLNELGLAHALIYSWPMSKNGLSRFAPHKLTVYLHTSPIAIKTEVSVGSSVLDHANVASTIATR